MTPPSPRPQLEAEDGVFPRTLSLAVHEIRTPVTVVSGYLRMLLRELAGPLAEKQRKMLEEAERSCARISSLVAEMSDIGKLESAQLALTRQAFELGPVLAHVAGEQREGADRGVRLEVRAPADPVWISGDRERLTKALSTLVHSALREQGEPSVIIVECAVTGEPPARWVEVCVGVDTALQELRETGRQTAPAFNEWIGGLGLALPLARRVIEAHGGAVWSLAREGASRAAAAFRVPAAPPAAGDPAPDMDRQGQRER